MTATLWWVFVSFISIPAIYLLLIDWSERW